MQFRSIPIKAALLPATLALASLMAGSVPASAQVSDAHTAAAIARNGISLGHENPSAPLRLTAWLNLHHREALDARVKELYAPASPSYRHWLTEADLKDYLPTDAEVATVRQELEAHNLKVQSVDPYNLSIRFEGRTSDVESAFHTQISRYSVKGELARTTSSKPQLAGAAAPLLHNLGGLDSLAPKSYLMHPKDFVTGKQMTTLSVAQATPRKFPYGNKCFFPVQSFTKSGPVFVHGHVHGVSLTATGLTYGITGPDTSGGNAPSCGYAPKDVQGFYGMSTAYNMGYSGAGQTIVLIDAYLEPQALADGNLFNRLSGLPAFTASNFKAYNPFGANQTGFEVGGWNEETDLDVQWAHAIAPGAGIALVQAFSQDWEDFQAALLYAISHHLGNVISNSWGNPESYVGPLTADTFNQIFELGAAEGIAIQFASGDSGDFTNSGDAIAEVSAPADSPYVTAVGGTTIATNPIDGHAYHLGWGNNVNVMATFPVGIADPPTDSTQFYAGSGGGMSNYFARPEYQARLSGKGRQVPDVSALADPFTGVEIVISNSAGDQGIAVIGGTSLSSPIFSAMWAIVDQASGESLGQAAPYIARLTTPLIRDVLPETGPANTTAVETSSDVTTNYSADDLSQPLYTTTDYVSTLWVPEDPVAINLTFGTDSSLNVTQGWDNVTGWGTPDIGAAFRLLSSWK